MLVGRKVILRALRTADLDRLYDLSADIRKMGEYWPLEMPSEILWKNRLSETGWWQQDHGGLLITDHDDNIVGQIVIFKPAAYQNTYELGYRIYERDCWGKGYMTEAVSILVAFLFETRSVDRIQATTLAGNTASQRVLERCGFQYEGTMRKVIFHGGMNQDLRLYSILRQDSRPLKDLLAPLSDSNPALL